MGPNDQKIGRRRLSGLRDSSEWRAENDASIAANAVYVTERGSHLPQKLLRLGPFSIDDTSRLIIVHDMDQADAGRQFARKKGCTP
ncbi:hypothetical protein GCM10011342_22520 [Aquisalinus flavus]|uniref:Uncharacterized protein n=1 Tax=Aquisalinus flavus TaxID=1526572 RepID=A0A8J2V397_9PROT|nr:hypothetical protein GCM10011342_22520 [Aquisalinus flavus]